MKFVLVFGPQAVGKMTVGSTKNPKLVLPASFRVFLESIGLVRASFAKIKIPQHTVLWRLY